MAAACSLDLGALEVLVLAAAMAFRMVWKGMPEVGCEF